MRVIDIYKFHYGTKLPLLEIPDRIHSFFRDQGLKSDRFMYYFEDMADLGPYGKNKEPDSQGSRGRFSTHGCERILKDCPELGEIRYFNDKYNNRYSYLTNLDGESFPEEKLLPLMNKIHRRYGFFSTFLYYSDIDFFGETVPYEPTHEPSTISNLKDDQSPDFFDCAAYWSASNSPNPGIEIYRCSLPSDNFIALSVDALDGGRLRDTTPYYKALRAALPKMRSYRETVIRLTREEKTGIGSGNLKAAPLLEKCRAFFDERMPADNLQTTDQGIPGIAKAMRNAAESHGFTYKRAGNGDYKAVKRTERNAAIYVELEFSTWDGKPPVGFFTVSFQGAGFKHKLFTGLYRNPNAIFTRLNEAFDVIDTFEKEYLPELDACFPITPEWFSPADYYDKEYGGYHY